MLGATQGDPERVEAEPEIDPLLPVTGEPRDEGLPFGAVVDDLSGERIEHPGEIHSGPRSTNPIAWIFAPPTPITISGTCTRRG